MNDHVITMLIVDDIEDNRLVLQGICRKLQGVRIVEAADGAEAIAVCDEHRPKIVLMDMMMPVMDGLEATTRIKAKYPETIVMVITAVIDPAIEEQMIRAGASAYIRKPIDKDALRSKLQNYLALLRLREGSREVFLQRRAVNPFSSVIRCFKTIFQIETPEDMMDFGTWFGEWYDLNNGQKRAIFDETLRFFYQVMAQSITRSENLTVIAEENFEELFVTLVMDTALVLGEAEETFCARYAQTVMMRENTVYVRMDKASIDAAPKSDAVVELGKLPGLNVPVPEQKNEPQEEIRAISLEEKTILRQSFVTKITAKEYITDIGGDVLEEVLDLASLDQEWESAVALFSDHPTEGKLAEFADEVLGRYVRAINGLFEFEALAYALSSLGSFLKQHAAQIVGTGQKEKMALLLESLGHDLAAWRLHIFELQDALDIHYLDSSFFSSCVQIEGTLGRQVIASDEDDIEFF